MARYGTITYTDILQSITESGWSIVSQTPKETQIERKKGVPAIIGIPIALIPFAGIVIGALLVTMAGTASYTIKRELTMARFHGDKNREFDVHTQDDLDLFFTDHNYRRNLGMNNIVFIGLISSMLTALIFVVT